ncbi:type II toxin-antitoxin system RelE/ParE family toxin [Pseudoglutamicibacter albus]|uniref:Plasmid maintenance system killer n=1 Tax=Pseudoglutamicibacter albus DNF00011 TaxID=1401063 RepID=A0A095YEL4_9MICC|nr:type II toxin-antitoxin system RelE/ParE family toxin [Pseudoglutamicibacter albus]KGF20708.1 plasmid maintenance system killer [Pseudoglutamicibacter albus DNF00011]
MIRSFGDRDTELVWLREAAPRIDPRIHKSANRKLYLLDAAVSLNSLRIPPGNRLEALKGDRKGQHSIRINSQWRICFVWTEAGPENVIIEDYH